MRVVAGAVFLVSFLFIFGWLTKDDHLPAPPEAVNSGAQRALVPNATTSSSSDAWCSSDWSKCSDNADLIKNFNSPRWAILDAKMRCILVAERRAKYGNPVFPSANDSFRDFYRGNEYTKTGSVVLIERGAQFSNGYGAMAHVTVTCTYNLDQKIVSDLSIDEN